MGVYDTPTQLRLRQRTRFAAVIKDIHKVHKMIAEDGEEDFENATTGSVTPATLAAMGHPFGRLNGGRFRRASDGTRKLIDGTGTGGGRGIKGGGKRFKGKGIKGQITAKGVIRPLPINRQSGMLHLGIKLVGPVGKGREFKLFSNAPHAKFVLRPGGTRLMVDRGLLGRNGFLRKRHKARIAAYVDVVRKTGRKP